MHCNLRLSDDEPVIVRFNRYASVKFEVGQPIIAFLLLIPDFTL